MTEKLATFFGRLRPSPMRKVWLGEIGGVRISHRPYEIARRAGYDPQPDAFVPINRELAAKVLATVQKGSLLHGPRRYRESLFKEAKEMFAEFGGRAEFWSNSNFDGFWGNAWGLKSALSTRVVDTGVIGCSASIGFIYWVEEDD